MSYCTASVERRHLTDDQRIALQVQFAGDTRAQIAEG